MRHFAILAAAILSVACNQSIDTTVVETDSIQASDLAGAAFCDADRKAYCLDVIGSSYTLIQGEQVEQGTICGALTFQPEDAPAWYAAGSFGDGTLTLELTSGETLTLEQIR